MVRKNSSTKEINTKELLIDEVFISEACAVGIAWSNPSIYSFYRNDKLNETHFGNKVWKFYYRLGKHMYEKGVQIFDDISTYQAVKEMNVQKMFDDFGGYETVEELMIEHESKFENFEAYYEQIKRFSLLRHLVKVFGKKVLKEEGKYDYTKLSRVQLEKYWLSKVDKAILENSDNNIVAYDLLDDLDNFVEELDVNPDRGMALNNSDMFNEIINGWAYGTLGLYTSFSGHGKSSWVVEKIILGCIKQNERLLVICNEMDLKAYRKYLLITIMGNELYEKFKTHKEKSFNRKKINQGDFTDEEKLKLKEAVNWVKHYTRGNNSLIKLIPIEHYTMENVEAILRYWSRFEYRRIIIDTAKPSESRGDKSRWEQFVDDMEHLYKLVRTDALNLACICTAQNADNAKSFRYLDERVIGDGKKIKNVCDFVFSCRAVFEDERMDGDNELKIRPNRESSKREFTLNLHNNYYLLFTSKNRRGETNTTGLPCLVYETDFNRNSWKEIGWTEVKNDLF